MSNQKNPNAPQEIEKIRNFVTNIQTNLNNDEQIIGKGSFGQVTLRQDRETGQKYVIKKADKKKSCNQNQLDFYTKILKTRQSLQNYYPKFIQASVDDLNTYIKMEYLGEKDGWMTLEMIDNHNKINTEKIVINYETLSNILDDFHLSMIFHNDIKPQNIMMNKDTKEFKFIDFGFSFDDKPVDDQKLDERLKMGTPKYKLPECYILEYKKNNPEADIISIGIKKDKFSLLVCEFCSNQYKKEDVPQKILLDIPSEVNVTDSTWFFKYNILYGALLEFLVIPNLNYRASDLYYRYMSEYNDNDDFYKDQRDEFDSLFGNFKKK